MKLLTLNFLTCAIKTCKSSPESFPLHIRDAELESVEVDFNPLFIRNVLPRVEWSALGSLAGEIGLHLPPTLQAAAPTDPASLSEEEAKKLHELLLETQIVSGKLVCGNCGHEYAVREGIANFLLPAHLV